MEKCVKIQSFWVPYSTSKNGTLILLQPQTRPWMMKFIGKSDRNSNRASLICFNWNVLRYGTHRAEYRSHLSIIFPSGFPWLVEEVIRRSVDTYVQWWHAHIAHRLVNGSQLQGLRTCQAHYSPNTCTVCSTSLTNLPWYNVTKYGNVKLLTPLATSGMTITWT